jgi:hypothetical protein
MLSRAGKLILLSFFNIKSSIEVIYESLSNKIAKAVLADIYTGSPKSSFLNTP